MPSYAHGQVWQGQWLMRIVVASLLCLLLLAVAIIFFPLNALREPIAARAGAALNRPVTLAGDLVMHWSWPPQLEANDVTIGNAPGFDGNLFTVRNVRITITPWSLLALQPVLPSVILDQPALSLERHADGKSNWVLGNNASDDNAAPITIGGVRVNRGTVRVRDATVHADVTLAAWTEGEGTKAALHFGGDGVYQGQAFAVGGRGEGLSELRHVSDPYTLAFEAKAGATHVNFAGYLVPAQPENLRGALALRGQDASALYPLVPVPVPWTPPYAISGMLTHTGGQWHYTEFAGVVGVSDMRGTLSLDMRHPRRAVDADLQSRRFDYRDLGGFVGLPPGPPGHVANTTAQKDARSARAQTARVLPDTEYPLDKLREFDAHVHFRGDHVGVADLPLDGLDAMLTLRDGVMRVDPLTTHIGAGAITAQMTLDATGTVAKSETKLRLTNVDPTRFFPTLASPQGTAGNINGATTFHSTGNSLGAMLATANGNGALVMRGGQASTLTLVLTNLDLANAGLMLLRGDAPAQMRCAVIAYDIKDGVLSPSIFVVDTSAVVLEGQGNVNFATERYDLQLKARSKQASLFALRGPIAIGGTFSNPSVAPVPAPLAARIGAAIGLGVLAPPLALLPFVDLGLADDVDCQALLAAPHDKAPAQKAAATTS